MIDEKELEKLAIKQSKNKKNQISKVDIDKSIANWQLFYLNNLDIFTEDYLKIPLHHFQRQILLDCWENDIMDIVASRGLSKSFTIGILANNLALLLPGVNILITSMTLGQSNKIINEKIDDLLSSEKKGISPILKQLRKDGYMKFGKDDTGDARIISYGNGSKIFAVCCAEGGRSNRANITITDEARLIKRKDYDAIIEPTLEPYNHNGLFLEPKQIFMTSARTKDNWFWTHLKNTVTNHYKNKKIKYGFFGGDIFTAVANNVQTKKQYLIRRKNTNEFDFDMEFLNLWLGESEGSLFLYDDFHKNQNSENAFYPLTTMQVLNKDEQTYDFKDSEIRFISTDIAVSGGRENDNTIFMLGSLNTETFERKVEYIKSLNGTNSLIQAIWMKRLFYDYKSSYFVMDVGGIGNALYDILTKETYDEERNITYPAWNVCQDKGLQISSDIVINDKVQRVIDINGEPIIIPIKATSEINTNMHLSTRQNLKDGKFNFLKDESEMEMIFAEKDKKWLMYTSEKRADILMPFVETRFMVNEAISLNTEIKPDGIKVKEDRSATKDRYMALAMFSLFSDKLENKYQSDEGFSDIDFDNLQLVF